MNREFWEIFLLFTSLVVGMGYVLARVAVGIVKLIEGVYRRLTD